MNWSPSFSNKIILDKLTAMHLKSDSFIFWKASFDKDTGKVRNK